ncbi:hypothetical protein GCM10011490_17390 [Pseudoclavibacter endophyticus]|uniref:Cation:proton antiporter n=1 Tax=Pseudoclavibacter endophyticus TaxID=1778590 RepID=A0A6H9WLG8_9MICO|nr:cation:proton antiporter [Pseudoclavibacter endophyticus]KAB1648908.1 cation:proton antiporter [Pseudoclavibacter endophyticus]GGA67340.1 hypothetical protein GCM10011490_17390 [Pseudoclavibacter endophyticus]
MTFATLALICAVALIGPLLAAPRGLPVLVVVGELAVGVILGTTGFGILDPHDTTFELFADIGFALVMFVAGSSVPLVDSTLRRGVGIGALRAGIVGAVALPLGFGLDALFGTGHGPLYAVLIASSSAAFIVPALKGGSTDDGERFSETGEPEHDPRLPPEPGTIGKTVAQLLPQVAIADAVCILLLPLAIDPPRAGTAAMGALLVIAAAAAVFGVLWWTERTGARKRVKRVSEDRGLAIELRASLAILFALAAIATWSQVSIMLAGFAFGLAVAAVGPPRRLTKQLFALTEGFFAPIFYVWLGASLGLRSLFEHPESILLGFALGVAAVVAHAAGVVTRQRPSAAILTSAQLGVPIAAATTGLSLGVFDPGEDASLLLSAIVTIAVCTLAAVRVNRAQRRDAEDAGSG